MRKGEIACNKQFLLYSQWFLPYMVLIVHFKMLSAICLNLDRSEILSSGNGLMPLLQLKSYHGSQWRTCVSWLSHTSTNTSFFPKPPTTFLTYFSKEEGRKYAKKKVHLNRVSNSQPSGHESDTLTTEPLGWGPRNEKFKYKTN